MITIILYFFLVLLSAGYAYSEDQLSLVIDEIEEPAVKEIICSLTSVKPYYDCSEKWTIYLYDVEFPDVCNENVSFGIASKGCTTYTTFRDDVISATINLGNAHGSQTSFPYPEGPEYQTVLYHELQHVICGCTWHTEISHDFIN
jgi:hypothetical protein